MTTMNAETVVLADAEPAEEETAARLIHDTGSYVFDCLYNRDFDAYLRITSALWLREGGAPHVHARAALHDAASPASRSVSPQTLYEQEFGTGMMAMAEMGTPELLAHSSVAATIFLALPRSAGRCVVSAFLPRTQRRAAAASAKAVSIAQRAPKRL